MKKFLPKSAYNTDGFTLVELMVVISIIAILATVGLLSYSGILRSSRDSKRQSDLKFIQSALEGFYSDLLFYPTDAGINGILSSGETFTSSTGIGSGTPPQTEKKYLNETPKDPITSTTTPYCYAASPGNCDNSASKKCTSYKLFAILENPPAGVASYSCGSVSTYKFQVTPP